MQFLIVEVDRDYNSVTDQKFMDFDSLEDAKKYCKEQTWTGHYYFVATD